MYHSLLRRPSRKSFKLAYLLSNIELANTVSLLHDLSHKLMAADEVGWAFEVSAVEVQVAAAESRGGNFEDCVGGLLDVGVGAVFDGDLGLLVSRLLKLLGLGESSVTLLGLYIP
jgi:hypothetical protein